MGISDKNVRSAINESIEAECRIFVHSFHFLDFNIDVFFPLHVEDWNGDVYLKL